MMRLLLVLAAALSLSSRYALADSVTILSFNVQNLFDTIDDPDNPGDDSYLPLAVKDARRALHDARCDDFYGGHPAFVAQCKTLDWSEEVYATKLERVADVITAMTSPPEVIVVQEVENRRVLDDLVGRHLPEAGYRVINLDTSDKARNRGIDVGMLTRLELAGSPQAHRITFAGDEALCGAAPDILQVPLNLPDGETLHVFGVHFTPRATRLPCRIRALRTLNDLALALPRGSLVVAVGDFNINCREARTAEISALLELGGWYGSPLVRHGCTAPGSFRDPSVPLDGGDAWSFLDMIIVSAALHPTMPAAADWFADLGSFGTIIVHPEQVRVDDADRGFVMPRWFDPTTGRGVSDHFPVSIRLTKRRN